MGRDGPVHRLIFAVDIEGSTERTNPAKGELRRILYDVLDRALEAAGIGARRNDGAVLNGRWRPHEASASAGVFFGLGDWA